MLTIAKEFRFYSVPQFLVKDLSLADNFRISDRHSQTFGFIYRLLVPFTDFSARVRLMIKRSSGFPGRTLGSKKRDQI